MGKTYPDSSNIAGCERCAKAPAFTHFVQRTDGVHNDLCASITDSVSRHYTMQVVTSDESQGGRGSLTT